MNLTKEQRVALRRVYERQFVESDTYGSDPGSLPSYLAFRRTVRLGWDCIMVPIPHANMWLGIELDGYTHS